MVARRQGTVHSCSDEVRRGRDARPGEPVRTCVGCRTRTAATGLLRVVAVDGALVPDPQRRHPGRGAWLHPLLECLRLAERRRAFSRALRFAGPLDSAAVRTFLVQQDGDATGSRSAADTPDVWNPPGARSMQRAGRSDMYPQQ